METTYDYPAKNTVREAWMHFLPVDLSHPNNLGLYLPGPENLEGQGYQKKFMAPSQLIGAEHDKAKFERVKANAPGIHLVSGNVLDAINFMIEKGLPRLRFANLDFDGNHQTFIEELLALARLFPSLNEGHLAITSFSARDQSTLEQGVVNVCKFYSGLPSTAMFITQYGRMIRRFESLALLIPRGSPDALSHFHREFALLWWIFLMLAVTDLPKGKSASVLDQGFLGALTAPLDQLTARVQQQLRSLEDVDTVFVAQRELRTILENRRVSWWISGMERYAYQSMNHNPMRTWFFRIVPILQDQNETAQSLLEQVWTLACRTPLVYIDPHGSRVTIEA